MDANEILAKATPEQVKWVLARLTCDTDYAAAKSVGVHPTTVSRWKNKPDLERAIKIFLGRPIETVTTILNSAAIDAAATKVGGLKSTDERVKQSVATEILDRAVGKPEQKVKHSGSATITLVGGLDLDDDV